MSARSMTRLALHLAMALLPSTPAARQSSAGAASTRAPPSKLTGSKLTGSKVMRQQVLDSSNGLLHTLQVRGGDDADLAIADQQQNTSSEEGHIVLSRRGFFPEVFKEGDPSNMSGASASDAAFHIQQVQGTGDCLFHSIAIGMAFADEQCHLDMYDASLSRRVRDLRELAVDTLIADPNRTLHLEGDQTIDIHELVSAAAEQYDMTPEAYCSSMRKAGVWGGGPEILALANALQRPIHVFEPVAACNGTEFRLQLCGAFGSPKFDESGTRVCIIAADDRFPNCKPTEVRRHGEGGNHFLALLPVKGS